MDDAGAKHERRQAICDLQRQIEELLRAAFRPDRTPYDKFHHQIVRPDIVNLAGCSDDSTPQRPGLFALEAFGKLVF
jgi:hypothetical protein